MYAGSVGCQCQFVTVWDEPATAVAWQLDPLRWVPGDCGPSVRIYWWSKPLGEFYCASALGGAQNRTTEARKALGVMPTARWKHLAK